PAPIADTKRAPRARPPQATDRHLRPAGKPPPPRPRSPAGSSWSSPQPAPCVRATASARPPPVATYASSEPWGLAGSNRRGSIIPVLSRPWPRTLARDERGSDATGVRLREDRSDRRAVARTAGTDRTRGAGRSPAA